MKKIFSLLLMLFSFQHFLFSQDPHLVDSLETVLKSAKSDTIKADILYALSKSYWGNNSDKAMDYGKQTLTLSEQIGYKKGIGNAYNSIGAVYDDKGDYLQSLQFYKKSLKIRNEIGDKNGIAWSFNNIGEVYRKQSNYPEALKNYFSALIIREEIKDKRGIAASYINIGIINRREENYPEALKNNLAALKIYEEIGNNQGVARSYGNIGIIYGDLENYPEALKNHLASLKLKKEIGDKQGIASSNDNIGSVYYKQGNYSESLKHLFAALNIQQEIDDKHGSISSYLSIGYVYTKLKKYIDASKYLNKALSISKDLVSLDNIQDSYDGLASLDSAQGNFKQGWENYKLSIITRDSIFNLENTKKIVQSQMQYDFDKKESLTKAEQEKKDAVAQKEVQKQKLVRNGFIGGFTIVLLFAGVFFSQRNKIGKEKKRSEELLLNILPMEVAEELKQTGHCKAKTFSMVTVMFVDFKDFTTVSEKISAELLVAEIDYCFSAFDNIIQKFRIEKIKTIGDAYICAAGLPVLNFTHPADMINSAIEIRNFMLHRKKEKEDKGEIPFELRIGIHTGAVVAGIVGVKKFAYDIWGDTVNLAARMESSGEAGKVNISGTTYELVKEKFNCVHRGKIEAKHKGEIDMYFVENIS